MNRKITDMNLKKILTASWLIFAIMFPVNAREDFYNVLDFGAKGDGKTNNTKAINAAIEAASKNGGGTVYFPAGDFLSFTIHLKSRITLYLDNGAVLIGDQEVSGFRAQLLEKQPDLRRQSA
jgi:polygalacturonase